MSNFTSKAEIEILDNNQYKLISPFEYHVGDYPSQDIIKVPAGFITDLTSIPRILWFILHPCGQWAKSSIIHDYLYSKSNTTKTRLEADKIFLEGLKVLKVPLVQRYALYYAVRLFGASSFKGSLSNK